jgi:hypothetical protein
VLGEPGYRQEAGRMRDAAETDIRAGRAVVEVEHMLGRPLGPKGG